MGTALLGKSLARVGFQSADPTRLVACVVVSLVLHALLLAAIGVPALERRSHLHESAIQVLIGRATPSAVAGSTKVAWDPLPQYSEKRVRQPNYPPLLSLASFDFSNIAEDESAYLPLAKVTLRPSPVKDVFVPYPDGIARNGIVTTRLVLLIDENGSVKKVTTIDRSLPVVFQEAAEKAFEQATFHPAKIDNMPVKVRMVVEVAFEDLETRASNRARGFPPMRQ